MDQQKSIKLEILPDTYLLCSVNLPHYELINYPKSSLKSHQVHCVMCGLHKGECEIPSQNKDICKKCDSAFWLNLSTNLIIKFCKGIYLS